MNKTIKTHKKPNKFEEIIDRAAKTAQKNWVIDLELLDQIPDDDSHNQAIPFPYGGSSNFKTWEEKNIDC